MIADLTPTRTTYPTKHGRGRGSLSMPAGCEVIISPVKGRAGIAKVEVLKSAPEATDPETIDALLKAIDDGKIYINLNSTAVGSPKPAPDTRATPAQQYQAQRERTAALLGALDTQLKVQRVRVSRQRRPDTGPAEQLEIVNKMLLRAAAALDGKTPEDYERELMGAGLI